MNTLLESVTHAPLPPGPKPITPADLARYRAAVRNPPAPRRDRLAARFCDSCGHPCEARPYRDGDEAGSWWVLVSDCHGEPVVDAGGREVTDFFPPDEEIG